MQNKVEDLLKNREDLQKYLLATEDLNRTIEESLQLAVSHGKLNDETPVRHVSERDDPDYNFFHKNDNPLDVVYKEQAKFDVQNPIIGSLLKQINRGKSTYDGIKKTIDKGPDPKDLELEKRYRNIFEKEEQNGKKNFVEKYFGSNNDDDDDSPPGLPRVPPAPQSPPTRAYNPFGPPPSLEDPDPLIRTPKEYYFPYSNRFEDRNYDIFDTPFDFEASEEPEQINLDGNLREVFPDADEALKTDSEIKKENVLFSDFSEQLDRGEIPKELEFFFWR